jgi:hypothetical protein
MTEAVQNIAALNKAYVKIKLYVYEKITRQYLKFTEETLSNRYYGPEW